MFKNVLRQLRVDDDDDDDNNDVGKERVQFAKPIAKINFATGSLRLSALPSLNQDRANDDKYRNYASSNEPLNLRAKNHLSLDHLRSNQRYDQKYVCNES